ncbi:XRE family transcriptional regulator [Pseudomonas sp. 21LCFQ010]|uniref:XRE family transcriptional regulator n=1 Tax=Pseudomonas sp. 21LCFQ010 TaxID=2957506 RepID=UPI0020977D4A|nr:XRE family transcriptional regulator [Pseudomonas sp. 21LCFQ010]MCO8164865.1 XRE family transcriptional regulator [Pseudomonas sp. 21LCFQ010]
MKRIKHYDPPSAGDLARLKDDLGFTSPQMADLSGLAQGAQWRKYTGGAEPRALGMHMHFYMAALLTLDEASLARVVECMREQGAEVDLGPLPAGPQ